MGCGCAKNKILVARPLVSKAVGYRVETPTGPVTKATLPEARAVQAELGGIIRSVRA